MMKDLFVCQLYFSLKLRIEGSERHQTFVIVSDDTAREDNLWLQYCFGDIVTYYFCLKT
jgi:hypothetical protein